ncbi:uncharacterized protein LOC111277637 [Durio zibethinus]|uniref:ATP-dependent DNA helicase n=1 Tax=Durio zibethinus TaxID=66656 RepID=A0A6P5WUJ0_DURZI|nr:uncharacterized protein LOC111277637 [Durio zibethinus]
MAYRRPNLNLTLEQLQNYTLSGGTGKIFLWRTIISKIRSQGNIVIAVAYLGSPFTDLLSRATLIIWDEALMTYRYAFEAVDRMLQDIMHSKDPNSKKTMILGGDFSLILDFSQWLLNLGDGKLPLAEPSENVDSTWINIPDEFLISHENDSIRQIDCTYPNLENTFNNLSYLKDRAILALTNEVVDQVNIYILFKLSGEVKKYLNADRISPTSANVEEQSILYPQEFLNSLKFLTLPNHEIDSKVRVIEAETITETNVGSRLFIPRVEMSLSESKWPFTLTRR